MPISTSSERRLIPLALNHLGARGPHFTAFLKEMGVALITRTTGCYLTEGPFAMSRGAALAHLLGKWGARLTWCAQREYAASLVRAVMDHKASSNFLQALAPFRTSAPSMTLGSCG